MYLCSCIGAVCVQYDAVYCNFRGVGYGVCCVVNISHWIGQEHVLYCIVLRSVEMYCVVLYWMPCHAMPCHAMPCHFCACHAETFNDLQREHKERSTCCPTRGRIDLSMTDRTTDLSAGDSKLGGLDPFSRPLGPCKLWSVRCLRADSLKSLFRIGG